MVAWEFVDIVIGKIESKVRFLTSEGKTRADGNATRGRWCHLGGLVDGEQAWGSISVDSLRLPGAPGPMRINPDNPFLTTPLRSWAGLSGDKEAR